MSAIKTGLGAYGTFRTYSGAVVAVIIALSGCVLGGYLIKNPDKHTAAVQGTVTEASKSTDANGKPVYSVSANYIIGDKKYSVSGQTDAIYSKNQSVKVYYDPNNPSDSTFRPNPPWLGWAVIGITSLVALLAVGFAYFFSTLSNTGKAAVGGFQAAGNAMSFFRSD